MSSMSSLDGIVGIIRGANYFKKNTEKGVIFLGQSSLYNQKDKTSNP